MSMFVFMSFSIHPTILNIVFKFVLRFRENNEFYDICFSTCVMLDKLLKLNTEEQLC